MLNQDYELYFYSDLHMKPGSSHTHRYFEFYFFIDGDVTMHISDSSFKLKSGDLIIIPPYTSHYATVHENNKYYQRFVFWISEEYYNGLISTSDNYEYVINLALQEKKYVTHYDSIHFNALQAQLFEIINEINHDKYGKHTRLPLMISQLFLDINRHCYESNNPQEIKKESGLYENIIAYIENHLSEDLNLEDLSERFFVSKYHVSHLFKNYLGLSVHQCIMKKRLAAFKENLLETDNISESYINCGFKDYSCFYRAFTKEYGISPSEYHKNLKEQLIQSHSSTLE